MTMFVLMKAACARTNLNRLGLFWLIILIFAARSVMSATQATVLFGSVVDEDGSPVERVEVTIHSPAGQKQSTYTDIAGRFDFSMLSTGDYRLSLNKVGFFSLTDQLIQLKEGENRISLTFNHETEIHEQIEVYSTYETIEPEDTSHTQSLIAREIRDIPVTSTHDLRSSLQILPEVIRDNSGQLHVAGGRSEETQYQLDGFDIGDPVSGDLSVRVNVDSVRVAEVDFGRYDTRYGNAGAGVMSLDTAVGDDRWRAGATNFLPAIRAQRGLRLGSWYPRLTLSGPLSKGRAWFSEALSIQHTLSLIKELPREADSVSQWAGDNLLRAQINLTPQNILQGSFLYNQQNITHLGLGPFSPVSTTRNLRDYRSFFSVKDQAWTPTAFYELGMAADISHGESLAQGNQPYLVSPNGTAGNYFESLRQKTRRWQAIGSVTFPSRNWYGKHDLQIGFNVFAVGWTQNVARTPIEILRVDKTLFQRTTFNGERDFHLSNTRIGGYLQDRWDPINALVLQFGLRVDWDRILQRTTMSPRISASFLPFPDSRGKLTAAWGIFLQPVTLSILGPAYDQERLDVFYDASGTIPAQDPVTSRFILPTERLKQPRFNTTSLSYEHKLSENSYFSANFILRKGRLGLAYEKMDTSQRENRFLLQNNRRDRYRSIQVSFRHSFNDKTAIAASYTRSSATTNRVFDYSLGTLIFAPQQAGPLDWDAPNRFVSSGYVPTPLWKLLFSYFFEYRTGFPFSVVNEKQQLVEPANGRRFPDYISLNLGIEKRFNLFHYEWAIRLTIPNASGSHNPDAVINNVDSPKFLYFSGGRRRSITARLRLVGKKIT